MKGLKLQSTFAEFLYRFFNGLLFLFQRILFRRTLRQPKTILIFRTGNLGDTISAVPPLLEIQRKFPNARRIFLTNEKESDNPSPAEVLKGWVEFDKVIAYQPKSLFSNPIHLFRLLKELRKEKIDLLIYLGQSIVPFSKLLRDMIFFRAAGCRFACGFRLDTHRYFVLAQRYYHEFLPEPQRLMSLLSSLGISGKIEWEVPSASLSNGKKIPEGRPLIGIHPGAKYPVKRWPLDRFAKVGAALIKRYGASFVILGGKDAKREADFLVTAFGSRAADLTGQTDFLESAELLRRCDLLLANDSGPVHLAAAVGTPVVGIYSARDFPKSWYPYGSQHQVLRKDVDCQICYLEQCPVMTCLDRISTDDVISACQKALEG